MDKNWNVAMPFLLIAPVRSGGTMVSHLLDSHPDVFCARHEVLHPLEAEKSIGEMSERKIAQIIWAKRGYFASGFKITCRQLNRTTIVEEDITGLRVLMLVRKDRIAQAFSQWLVDEHSDLQDVHSFNPLHQEADIAVDSQAIVQRMLVNQAEMEAALGQVQKWDVPYTFLIYEKWLEGLSDEGILSVQYTERALRFLETDPLPLVTRTKKINRRPIQERIVNYDELVTLSRENGFYEYEYQRESLDVGRGDDGGQCLPSA